VFLYLFMDNTGVAVSWTETLNACQEPGGDSPFSGAVPGDEAGTEHHQAKCPSWVSFGQR